MFEKARQLLFEQKLAVLSTCCKDGQPYANLIAFAVTDDLKTLIFVTKRETTKFENLSYNPKAAVLVENSKNTETDFENAVAVTLMGKVKELQKSKHGNLLDIYKKKHKNLESFLKEEDCALLGIDIEKIIAVDNFQNVSEIKI